MTFDVIVIGGGLLGRAISFQLAQNGINTACIYQRELCQGQASTAAGAMLGVFSEVSRHETFERSKLEVYQRLCARNLYDKWLEEISDFSGIKVELKTGLFLIANSAGEDDYLEIANIRKIASSFDSCAQLVSPRNIPGLNPQKTALPYDSIFLSDEGSIDTKELLTALDKCLIDHSYTTVFDAKADSINLAHDKVVSIKLASGETLAADQIVLAGGVEITSLIQKSSITHLNIPYIFSGRGVSLVIKAPFEIPHAIRTPNRGFACGTHLLPRTNNTAYLGATNRLSTTPIIDCSANLGEIDTLLNSGIKEINTNLKNAELLSISVGHRPLALDKLPIVGRTLDARVLVASGTYRNGILLAPLIAAIIEEEITSPGIHSGHPFQPLREFQAPWQADLETWLKQVSKSLVSTICEPGGNLPDCRGEDLEKFFHVMLNTIINLDYDKESLLRKTKRLIERAPIEEVIPLLFETIIRHS